MIDASAGMASLLESRDVSIFVMVELLLDNSLSYRYSNLPYDITSRGVNWIGGGNLVAIEPMQEGTDLQAFGVEVTLSGVEESSIATVLREPMQDRELSIYLGGIRSDGTHMDPVTLWKGYASTASAQISGGVAAVKVTAENAMARWHVPCNAVYSDSDQQQRYPGDRFFEYQGDAAQKVTTLAWPSAGFFRR